MPSMVLLSSIWGWLRTNWSQLTVPVLCFAVGIFLATRCTSAPVASPKQQIVYRPAYVRVKDTVAVVKLVDKIVVKAVYVPRVASDADTKPKYQLSKPGLAIQAKTDSAGLQIDSLSVTNRQTIIVGVDKHGLGLV